MKTRLSDTAPRWTVKTYPPRSTMNPAIGQRYVGPEIEKGQTVSGVIERAGNYNKHGEITTFVVLLDQNGHRGATAVVSADAVREHLKGLALCAYMESDNG